jgi:hypothetical protein
VRFKAASRKVRGSALGARGNGRRLVGGIGDGKAITGRHIAKRHRLRRKRSSQVLEHAIELKLHISEHAIELKLHISRLQKNMPRDLHKLASMLRIQFSIYKLYECKTRPR